MSLGARRIIYWLAAALVAAALAILGLSALDSARSLQAGDAALVAGSAPAAVGERSAVRRLGDWLLGASDDRDYRDALGLERAARGSGVDAAESLRLRAEAERILAWLLRRSGDDRLRSRAANLLGELLFAEAKADPRNPRRFTQQAFGAFQDAVLLDSSNHVARRNLELLARLPEDLSFEEQPPAGDEASTSPEGSGF